MKLHLLERPLSISEQAYHLSLLGPVLFATSIGLQSMMALIFTFGPLPAPPPASQLTLQGKAAIGIELELWAYIAGCSLTVLLTLGTALLWNRYLHRHASEFGRPAAVAGAAILAGAGVCTGLLSFLFIDLIQRKTYSRWIEPDWTLSALESAVLFIPPALGAAIGLTCYLKREVLLHLLLDRE